MNSRSRPKKRLKVYYRLYTRKKHFTKLLGTSQKKSANFFSFLKTNKTRHRERVQALAGISRSALYAFPVYKAISLHIRICCHSSETRALIANAPNSAQLEGTPYHSPKLHPGPCMDWECGDGQRHRHTDGCGHYISRLGYASREM